MQSNLFILLNFHNLAEATILRTMEIAEMK